MLFYSFEFIYLFLPVTVIGYFFLSRYSPKTGLAWLVGCSLFFYAWWNTTYLLLLVGSIFFNYYFGLLLLEKKSKSFLVLGVTINLALIAYYKYAGFLTNIYNDVSGNSYDIGAIVLPLAISFFTFQQIAWLVDSYRGKILSNERGLLEYMLFVTFFPQLIAGPIVHHSEMMPQFHTPKNNTVNWENIAAGLTIFAIGLGKKVIIADSVAPYANSVFDAPNAAEIGYVDAWVGATAYTLQLYFDFSGYADMAIGLARMFNIHLPLNFDSPYKAETISDFWRRWHMTLSRFLRDYVYISLGGNRKGEARRMANLLITMLLGGIWHGAGWTFIIWGGLHGIYLTLHHLWDRYCPIRLPATAARLITLVAVSIAWVFFRADSYNSAIEILYSMFQISSGEAAMQLIKYDYAVYMIPVALFIALFFPNTQELMGDNNQGIRVYEKGDKGDKNNSIHILILKINITNWKKSPAWLLYIAGITILSLYLLVNETNIQEFIYFQF